MREPYLTADETGTDEMFDAIVFAFMDEWEAGDVTGERPTLGDYTRRYPDYAEPLIDFILSYVRMKRGDGGDAGYTYPLSPEAERAGEKVRESLGLAGYATGEASEMMPAEDEFHAVTGNVP